MTLNFRCGDRVRIKLNGCYRYYLDGLEGIVAAVYHDSVLVNVESDPAGLQRVVAPGGATGPTIPRPIQRRFQFNELEIINP